MSEETKALVEKARDLSNRLRGRYAKGPIQANGEPEFGWAIYTEMPDGRPFPGLYGEAAAAFDLYAEALIRSEQRAEDMAKGWQQTFNTAIGHQEARYKAEAALTAAQAQIDALKAALEPFAKAGEAFQDPSWGEDDVIYLSCDDWTVDSTTTVGDYRRALNLSEPASSKMKQGASPQ